MSIPPWGRAARHVPQPARISTLLLCCVLLAALVGPAGCGYGPDRAGLPGDARTLGIGIVRNETFAGELDIRLKRELRQRLMRNPRVQVANPEASDLIIGIRLTTLTVDRGRTISSTSVTSLTYNLTGDATLTDQRDGRVLFSRQVVTASAILNFDIATLETPAVRDEVIDDVLASFAEQVEAKIMTTF